MIRFNKLNRSFGETSVLKDVSFEIQTGELVCIIGASGCGKTTLLKLINRLLEPSSGSIEIDGTDIRSIDPISLRRQMGYVVQQTGLFTHMTIENNIGIIPQLQKKPKQEIRARTRELLQMVQLDPDSYAGRFPSQLSGGQLQRVGVARAFATDPDIILMDEPFSALDPITRGQLQDELLSIQKQQHKTIVFVTHDIDEAIKLADRICILDQGRVEQFGPPEQILTAPASDHVKDFIGAERIWKYPRYLQARHVMSTPVVCTEAELSSAGAPAGQPAFVVSGAGELLDLAESAAWAPCSVAAAPEERLFDCLEKMEQAGCSVLPVLEGGVPVGVISQTELARTLLMQTERREAGA